MGVSARSEIAAGFVLANEDSDAVRAAVITRPEEFLPVYLHKSTVWQSADLPPQLRGQVALGQSLSRWRPQDVPVDEAQALEAAWLKALPPLDRGIRRYLRVRVGSAQDARRLRQLGSVDGLIIVPSLDSRFRPWCAKCARIITRMPTATRRPITTRCGYEGSMSVSKPIQVSSPISTPRSRWSLTRVESPPGA